MPFYFFVLNIHGSSRQYACLSSCSAVPELVRPVDGPRAVRSEAAQELACVSLGHRPPVCAMPWLALARRVHLRFVTLSMAFFASANACSTSPRSVPEDLVAMFLQHLLDVL